MSSFRVQRNSWRIALRMAWRDLTRYKGRSLLASLLIFLPVLALATALTFFATMGLNNEERIQTQFKGAAGSVSFLNDTVPTADRANKPTPARPLPGMSKPASASGTIPLDAVRRAARSGPVARFASSDALAYTSPDSAVRVRYASATGDEPLLSNYYRLENGRAPRTANEVVVTNVGRDSELPTSGTLTLVGDKASGNEQKRTVRIVGTALTYTEADVIGVVDLSSSASSSFLTTRAGQDVWGQYGGEFISPAHSYGETDMRSTETIFVALIATVGTIAVLALLAGPAFAASATRSRRSLGLLAANGATRPVLRRVVLTEALLLGALSAAFALAIGAAAGVLIAINLHRVLPRYLAGPADLPWWQLLGVFAVVVIASVVSALGPAISAGRTNLLQALRGQVSRRRVHVGQPLLGLAGVAFGVLMLFWAASVVTRDEGMGYPQILIGIPAFFIGAILLVPWCLAQAGKLASRLPISMRIAIRDISRQRTRATASVGAVLATVTALTTIGIFGASSDKHDRRNYQPVSTMNTAVALLGRPSGFDALRSRVEPVSPGMTYTRLDAVGKPNSIEAPVIRQSKVLFNKQGCTLQDAGLKDPNGDILAPNVTVMRAADVRRTMNLTSEQLDVLGQGGVILFSGTRPPGDYSRISLGQPHAVTDPSLTSVRARVANFTFNTQGVEEPVKDLSCGASVSLPARMADKAAANDLPGTGAGTALILETTAKKLSWPITAQYALMSRAGGLTEKDEKALTAVQPDEDVTFVSVERGYRSVLTLVLLVLSGLGALIMLMSAVLSTLLSQAESRGEDATLAAAGATRTLRRKIAAAHAGAICFLGALLGIALGFVPGIVLALTNTAKALDGTTPLKPVLGIPWPMFGFVLVAVPALAATIVALCVRKTPTVTRRAV